MVQLKQLTILQLLMQINTNCGFSAGKSRI